MEVEGEEVDDVGKVVGEDKGLCEGEGNGEVDGEALGLWSGGCEFVVELLNGIISEWSFALFSFMTKGGYLFLCLRFLWRLRIVLGSHSSSCLFRRRSTCFLSRDR